MMPVERTTSRLRAFIAVTHAMGQLCGRRLMPAFRQTPLSYDDAFDWNAALEAWQAADWQRLLHCEASYPSGMLPWSSRLLTSSGMSLALIGEQLYRHVQSCRDEGAHYLLFGDDAYPRLLSYVDDPPLALTLLGNPELLRRPCLSVVGARKACALALDESRRLGGRLAQLGIVSVSGGAYGCDIAVHQGVIAAQEDPCLALVILAGGINHLYPRGNEAMLREIIRRGGLLASERLWGAVARPYDFPVRNRIISGLAWELIVMQAGAKSGAMVTARSALAQGREVLVLRHPRDDVRADGSWQLLEDGAYAFSDADELLCSYRFYHELGGEYGTLA